MAEFPKFLGISMEMFLASCDDKESDVRMVADECLNRTVKMLLETNLGRLQVELYKEIKKNGPARSLRAALWRFAELSHLIRPQKCRPYVVNLLPCFNRICRRQEDAVQETLANSLKKTFPVLGSFTNDAEIKVLLKTFLPNLRSASAVTRRTAASSLVTFCQHSRKPRHFFCWLLTVLLGMVIPIQEDRKSHTLLGVLLCLRHLVPHLATLQDLEDDSLKGSFGVTKKDPELSVSTEQLVQIFELVLHYSQHTDHNVVTASLETFQQLLRTPPPGLLPVLTRPGSITQSSIFKEGGQHRVGSSSQLSGVGEEDSGMEDDRSEVSSTATDDLPPIVKLNLDPTMQSMEQSSSAADLETLDSSAAESSGIGLLQTGGEGGIFNALEKADSLPDTPTTTEFPGNVQDFPEHAAADDVIINADGGSYSNVEIAMKNLCLNDFRLTVLPNHRADSNVSAGSQEAERQVTEEVSLAEEGSEVAASAERMMGDVGHYTDEEVPLIYCTRLLCSSFLLTGHEKGLIRDREVRVSVKALSLGCLAAIFNLHPRALSIKLFRPSQDTQGPESRQLVRDILLFSNHGDPQLKGNTAVLVGNFIHSALTEARLKYDLWIQAICEEQGTPPVLLESLVSCLQTCLTDQASVTCRMACVALKTCLVTLLQSSSGDLGLRLVLATLGQRDTSYWLGKVELLELLSQVDFKLVKYLEDSFPYMRKGDHSYLGAMNCQQRLLEDIVLHLMGDDDYRVRHAATAALGRLVPRLFYPVDHPQHDPVVASAKEYSSAHLEQEGQQQSEEPYRPPPCTMWGYETSGLVSASLESSLSRVVSAIMRRLNSSTSKSLTFGCLHALCQLSQQFPVCQYTTAWCCVGITTFTPKDSSGRTNLPRPGSRSRSLNGSLTSSMTSSLTSSITSTSSISSVSSQLSMEESITGSGGGPLPMVLSLLLSSWLPLDLAAHQDALLLAGNLLAGAASRSLKAPYDEEKPTGKDGVKEVGKEEEDGWHALQDRNLVPLAQQLLSHLARVVNVCSHVIEQVIPGPPAKTALPSLPNAPSLSPIKRKPKGKDGVDQGSATASPSKSSAKKGSDAGLPTEKEPDRPNKSNIGTFWQLPGYMKLYSVLKGAYSNYKVSLDPSATEKFLGLLKTVLNVLSQVLEIATFIDISKYVEELLSYLKSTVAMEPTSTIQCVEQLLKALFGTNLASQWDGSQTAETSRKPGKATRLSSNMKPGLYHYCFTAPYTQFTQSLAAASFRTSQAEGEEGGGILSWFKHRSSDKKVSPAIAKLVKGDKTPIHNYIRLFEPLVIKSLKLYTVTSSVTLQRQVLHLLAQLVQLRVNYCLLDSDQIFIGFVIKQFEYIEAGQIRGSETLIPPIFHFLVLLSYERYHSKSIIVMPRIIQLCDGVMASGQKATNHAIPALQPIVHDLFVLRGNSKADQGKELDTQREVVVSMLVRLIHYPEVLEMLTIVLQQCHKESEDRWKKLSRQVVDMVLPMLARQQICLSTPSALNTLHGLFESVTPSSLRPLDMLLKTLFSPPTDLTSPDSFLRWSSMVLSVLRVLISQSKEEVIMARLQELGLSANIFTNNVIYRAKGRAVDLDGDAPFEEVPEEALARFLLQVIGALAEEIAFRSNTSVLQREGCHSLAQQLAHLLLYVTYILKSGLFRKVLSAAMALPVESPTEAYYSVEQLNHTFLTIYIFPPGLFRKVLSAAMALPEESPTEAYYSVEQLNHTFLTIYIFPPGLFRKVLSAAMALPVESPTEAYYSVEQLNHTFLTIYIFPPGLFRKVLSAAMALPVESPTEAYYSVEQLNHTFLTIYIFPPGLFRKVLSAAMALPEESPTEAYYSVEQLNHTFLTIYIFPPGLFRKVLSAAMALPVESPTEAYYSVEQLNHTFLTIYIFPPGLFRKVLSAAMALPEESPTEAYYSVEQLNLTFLTIHIFPPSEHGTYEQFTMDHGPLFTHRLFRKVLSAAMALPEESPTEAYYSVEQLNLTFLTIHIFPPSEHGTYEQFTMDHGPLFTHTTATLYGELVLEKKCQNLSDVEHMTWVIINHVKDLIELAQEPPVQDFISAIHRNSAASGLFLQAIHSRCEKLSKPCIVKSMLGCLEGIHLTQSGTLLTLLIDKFLQTPHHALARMCDSLACRRVEMILAQPVEDSRTQFPVEDVEKLQVFMRESGLALRHQRLASLLARFKAVITQQAVPPVEPPPSSHPLDAANINIASLSINKDLYVATVQDHCFRRDSNAQECALMLSKLDYSDVLTIMMTKEFHMRLLEDSISVGLQQSRISSSLAYGTADVLNRTRGLKLGKAHHLLRASCITLLRHVSNVVNILPSPQQLVSPGNHHPGNHASRSRTPPREKYRLKMDMLFADREWRHSVFHMAAGLTVYLLSLSKIPEQCQIPEDSFTDICRFSILVLEILCYLLYKGRTPSSQQLQTAVECCCAVLKNPQLFTIMVATEHANLVTTAVGSIHQVVKSVCISAGEKLSPVSLPEPGESKNISEDQQRALLACRQMCELLQCLTTTLSPGNTRLPQFLAAPLRNVVLNLARLPLVNSYARTPPIVWKMGWGASPGGETGTKLPELPFDFLQEREVLKDFIFRINAVGWTSRTQFEETWAGLLGILSALPITVPAESREEEIEKTQANVLAVRTITALVLDSTLHPQPGNPASSVYEYRPRSKPPSYINTRWGRKLAQVRHIVEKEIMAIAAERCDLCSHHQYFNMQEQQLLEGEGGLYSADVHRTLGFTDYGLGHVSIKSIWSDNHILNQTPDTDEEPDFPDQEGGGTAQPMVTTPRRFRGGLDIHSCLQFLVELYSQWMEPTAMPRTPVPLLCEVAKSILLISDLFTELRQYEWMFDSLLELNKIHPVEDEILLQYVVPGVCKAGAVMGMEGPVAERVSKLLESSLKSTHLPTKVGSVYGSLYILEAGPSEATKLLVPVLQDYLSKSIPPIAQCCIVHVEPHVLAMCYISYSNTLYCTRCCIVHVEPHVLAMCYISYSNTLYCTRCCIVHVEPHVLAMCYISYSNTLYCTRCCIVHVEPHVLAMCYISYSNTLYCTRCCIVHVEPHVLAMCYISYINTLYCTRCCIVHVEPHVLAMCYISYINTLYCTRCCIVHVEPHVLAMCYISYINTLYCTRCCIVHVEPHVLAMCYISYSNTLYCTRCCIVHVEPHVLAMWATAFYLMEHYQEDLKESDFKVQLVLNFC
uniref:Huntingtin n=1 Tax=Branchiostoma floridae TaxID=7739 RepID=C3ZGJ9_BRAFL|eukprot:XP_002592324.1 hypothetical protein BRAFLDRAFT_101261 [Branchiostoma floridae]